MTDVKIIQEDGLSVVVQYFDAETGIARRAVIPYDAIENGQVEDGLLAMASGYGPDLREIAITVAKKNLSYAEIGNRVAAAMAGAGIWTADDLKARKREARFLILSEFGPFFPHFFTAVMESEPDGSDSE